MSLPTDSGVLVEVERSLCEQGRVALCQVVRTEGSTPGKVGWKLLVRPDGSTYGNLGGGAFEALVKRDAVIKLEQRDSESEVKRYYLTEEAVRGEPTGMVCGGLAEVFLEVLRSKPLVVICGGGPVGQALATHADLCGFEVLIAEDREEFCRVELFPSEVRFADVGRAFEADFLAVDRDRDLYVAVVSRCWETDLAALASLSRQRPPRLRYLGLMGSTRKIERVRSELVKQGHAIDDVEFHAPIGLPIGGATPAEIAISILAEMIQVRSGPGSGSASDSVPEER